MLFDQIILSCNEDPTYSEFWEPVSWAYKKMFPDVTVHLAFVTKRKEDDPVVQRMRQFGKMTLFKPLPDIPEGHQAKVARFWLASQQWEEVCYIDDIDLFPLRKDFIENPVARRPFGVLLCVGAEVYGYTGTYPISQMTGEGWLFKQFINPRNESYEVVLRSWKDKARFDDRENINIWPDMVRGRQDYYFSDERLLKRLIFENPVPKLELSRGYDDFLEATIDRHTYNRETDTWVFDHQKRKAGGYVNAHCIRPFEQHKEKFAPLFAYINRNYE